MRVKFAVADLLLCEWVDPAGRARTGTFAPSQLDSVGEDHLLWVRVCATLAARWPVVIASHQ